MRIRKTDAVQPVQMNIYLSNAYRIAFSWLHCYDDPKVKGGSKRWTYNPTDPFL